MSLGTAAETLIAQPAPFAPIVHETTRQTGLRHRDGTVSMARTNDPNSARSQFFIVFKDSNFLDGQYTVWGKVTSGMEFVDKIVKGEPPANPDRMITVRVAADVA